MPQSLSAVNVHFIFSAKGRTPFLKDPSLRRDMHAQIGEISKRLGCPVRIVGGVEDHVHALVQLGRSVSQADWVKEVKRVSSAWAHGRGVQSFSWQGGYGAFSVDYSGIPAVTNYIAGQEEHHKKVPFQEEYLALLKEHGIEWDDAYVWD